MPVEVPVEVPVESPVESPVEVPVEEPVEAPVAAPVMEPSATEPGVGMDICACQSGSYNIVLDFDLECDDSDIEGSGISESACTVEPPNVDDPFVVEASNILISELDQTLQPVKETNLTGTYLDGDMVTYDSIIADDPSSLTPVSIPRGLQVSVTGVNADGTTLTNVWVILFTNDCGTYPVIESEMQIGWTLFVRDSSWPRDLLYSSGSHPLTLYLLYFSTGIRYGAPG